MQDVIIIGAGPAGLTAALYAGRYRLRTLLLEKSMVGGQIVLSPTIENFPGFPGGIKTSELIERLAQQVKDVGVDIEYNEAVEITLKEENAPAIYTVKTNDVIYKTKTLIVATGAKAKELGVLGERRFVGKGVSYCATCDAPLFRDKEVVVVGGGDRAVEEALYLCEYARKVKIIHRRKDLRAAQILQEKALRNPRIELVLDSVIEEILGEERVRGVRVRNVLTKEILELSCQGIFIFVGIIPQTSFLRNLLQLDDNGFIITDQSMQASRLGVFACGDCRAKSLYQVINACGDAAQAAYSAHRYILGG